MTVFSTLSEGRFQDGRPSSVLQIEPERLLVPNHTALDRSAHESHYLFALAGEKARDAMPVQDHSANSRTLYHGVRRAGRNTREQ